MTRPESAADRVAPAGTAEDTLRTPSIADAATARKQRPAAGYPTDGGAS